MASLMYVLLAVGYGLSVWSLARQRRYTPRVPLTTLRRAHTSASQPATRTSRQRAGAAAA